MARRGCRGARGGAGRRGAMTSPSSPRTWISPTSSASARPSKRSSPRPPAAIICSCAGRRAPARRCSRGGCPGILPDLDDRAALTTASIRSLSGVPVKTLSRTPPFEAPHHTASVAALVGGGSRVLRPGCDRPCDARGSSSSTRQASSQRARSMRSVSRSSRAPSRSTARRRPRSSPRGSSSSSRRIRARAATTASGAARAPARPRRSAATSGGCPGRCWTAWTSSSRWRASRSRRARRSADGDHDGRRARSRVAEARARAGRRLAEYAVASERPAARHVAARRARCAAAGGPPPARCRAPPRRAHPPRLRPRAALAWSSRTSSGRPQLGAEHIGRALYLKKGLAL